MSSESASYDAPDGDGDVSALYKLEGFTYVVKDRYDFEGQSCDKDTNLCEVNGVNVMTDYDDGRTVNCFDSTAHAKNLVEMGEFPGWEHCLDEDILEIDDDCGGVEDIAKNDLERGNTISMDFDGINHNVIFLEWVDKKSGKAKLLDWSGSPSCDTLPSSFAEEYDCKVLKSENALKSYRIVTKKLRFDESNNYGVVYAIEK